MRQKIAIVAVALIIALLAMQALAQETPQPAAPERPPIRVLVYWDMPGISGVDDWHMLLPEIRDRYRRALELLTGDLNAVIGGLFNGGAGEVFVVGLHTEPPWHSDRDPAFDRRAQLISEEGEFDPLIAPVRAGRFDAVVAIGMAAAPRSRGFGGHTIAPGVDLRLEDRSITEAEMLAYSWGTANTPLIFVAGDDRLRDDLRSLPWIEYVTTKSAMSTSSATTPPLDETHGLLRAGAEHAIRHLADMKPARMKSGAKAAVVAQAPASLALLANVPGIRYTDQRVDFTAQDFHAAYDAWRALATVATRAYHDILSRAVEAAGNRDQVIAMYTEDLGGEWVGEKR
ncbi:MAG TPA: M55 family metallopeptidase [Thermoanaerobaculia bacterium]|nr:M55 family metallopeptidase [Thermoanaerobaculia bacterium]